MELTRAGAMTCAKVIELALNGDGARAKTTAQMMMMRRLTPPMTNAKLTRQLMICSESIVASGTKTAVEIEPVHGMAGAWVRQTARATNLTLATSMSFLIYSALECANLMMSAVATDLAFTIFASANPTASSQRTDETKHTYTLTDNDAINHK